MCGKSYRPWLMSTVPAVMECERTMDEVTLRRCEKGSRLLGRKEEMSKPSVDLSDIQPHQNLLPGVDFDHEDCWDPLTGLLGKSSAF